MITYKRADAACFPLYDRVPMRLTVCSEYKIEKINRGLGGFVLTETPVKPYVKDFCLGDDESITRWSERFDVSNWMFFIALDGDHPVGAATVVSRTPGVHMLGGRDDLAVLWDIRVDEAYKHQGVGQRLFDMAADWARSEGLIQMKIECQNNNVPAVNFYHKQGAVLSAVDEYAYYTEEEYRHEAQLIWYLDL